MIILNKLNKIQVINNKDLVSGLMSIVTFLMKFNINQKKWTRMNDIVIKII